MKLTITLTIEADGFRSVCAHGSFVDVEADPFRFTASVGNGLQIDTEGWSYVLLDLALLTQLALIQELVEEADTHNEDGLLTEAWILEWLKCHDFEVESLKFETITEEEIK